MTSRLNEPVASRIQSHVSNSENSSGANETSTQLRNEKRKVGPRAVNELSDLSMPER